MIDFHNSVCVVVHAVNSINKPMLQFPQTFDKCNANVHKFATHSMVVSVIVVVALMGKYCGLKNQKMNIEQQELIVGNSTTMGKENMVWMCKLFVMHEVTLLVLQFNILLLYQIFQSWMYFWNVYNQMAHTEKPT